MMIHTQPQTATTTASVHQTAGTLRSNSNAIYALFWHERCPSLFVRGRFNVYRRGHVMHCAAARPLAHVKSPAGVDIVMHCWSSVKAALYIASLPLFYLQQSEDSSSREFVRSQ